MNSFIDEYIMSNNEKEKQVFTDFISRLFQKLYFCFHLSIKRAPESHKSYRLLVFCFMIATIKVILKEFI